LVADMALFDRLGGGWLTVAIRHFRKQT
jgi:hypothetical protein